MGKQHMIDSDMWLDSYFRALNFGEKGVFFYLLTCPLANIGGIYRISIDTIKSDTGLPEKVIQDALDKMQQDKKILFRDNYICVKNRAKYCRSEHSRIKAGIQNIIDSAPAFIREFLEADDTPEEKEAIAEDETTFAELKEVATTAAFHEEVKNKWNAMCEDVKESGGEIGGLSKITKEREKHLNARLQDGFDIDMVIAEIKMSSLLMGLVKNPGGEHENWKLTFDFVLNPNKFTKIMEHGYRDKKNGSPKSSAPKIQGI